jgi:phytoene dehydrogenase-like protein
MTDRFDVVVIGAGHNGLVCATYLARAGRKVACVEAREVPGGMAAPRTLADRYRFPGLAHAAFPVNADIRRDLKLDQFGYSPGPELDTVSLDGDRGHVVLGADSVSGEGIPDEDKLAYPRFQRDFREFAGALRPLFGNPPPRLKDMSSREKANLAKLGWSLRFGLGRESMYEFLRVAGSNMQDILDEVFVDERLKGAMGADAVLGSAMGPRTPGTVLTWLQRLYGALNGRMTLHGHAQGSFTEALKRSAEAAGVSIRCGSRVERIVTDDGRATGVSLSTGETLEARIVVSNLDPRATFLDLVGAPNLDAMFANRVRQIRGSGTVGKLHLALAGEPRLTGLDRSLLGNRLVLAPSLKSVEHAFNHSKYGEFSENPVLEITIPSLHESDLAPPGHHVMSVNVAYVPYRETGEDDQYRNELAERTLSGLEYHAPGLRSLIVDQEFLTPRDVESEYGAVQGHWHHGELSMHQSFMMRPVYGSAQYETPIENLFICGAGCHPGGGLTGIPGKNAARRVLEGVRKT